RGARRRAMSDANIPQLAEVTTAILKQQFVIWTMHAFMRHKPLETDEGVDVSIKIKAGVRRVGIVFDLGFGDGYNVICDPDDLDEVFAAVEGIFAKAKKYVESAAKNINADEKHSEPVDLWGKFAAPELPSGVLPPLLERFALERSEIVGTDAAAFAVSALV